MVKFKNFNNTTIRIISSIIMLFIAFISFYSTYMTYSLFILTEGIMIYEYNKLFNKKLGLKFILDEIGIIGITLVTIYFLKTSKFLSISYPIAALCIMSLISTISNFINYKKYWILEGLTPIYIGTGIISIMFLFNIHYGLLLYIFVITISTDTGAYFIGRLLKGKKLCPKISPNKTISGAIGGIITTSTIVYFFIKYLNKYSMDKYSQLILVLLIIISIILSIISQFGDLFESYIKRLNNTKDSSHLIPGHGGFLDRFDSILFVAPVTLIIFHILISLFV